MRSLSLPALVLAMLMVQGVHAQSRKSATAAAPAAPAPAAKDMAAETFKQWDKNADGQLSLPEFRAGWQQAQAAVQPVSYTHLDVYKRQGYHLLPNRAYLFGR